MYSQDSVYFVLSLFAVVVHSRDNTGQYDDWTGRYTTVEGDFLEALAKFYDTSVMQIMAHNYNLNIMLYPDTVMQSGVTIYVPLRKNGPLGAKWVVDTSNSDDDIGRSHEIHHRGRKERWTTTRLTPTVTTTPTSKVPGEETIAKPSIQPPKFSGVTVTNAGTQRYTSDVTVPSGSRYVLPDRTDERRQPSEAPIIDNDVIQCEYRNTFLAVCRTGCTTDPLVVDIVGSNGGRKFMKRECDPGQEWTFKWNPDDGILDRLVISSIKRNDDEDTVAVCTFYASNSVFECAGVASCNTRRRHGNDQCRGGLPWRGKKEGDPLNGGPVKGTIESYAENNQNGPVSPSQDFSEDQPSETTTNRFSGISVMPSGHSRTTSERTTGSRSMETQPEDTTTDGVGQRESAKRDGPRRTAGTEVAKDCIQNSRLCFYGSQEDGRDSCYSHNGDLRRKTYTLGPISDANLYPQSKNIKDWLKGSGLQHAECIITGSESYYCKGYSSKGCRRDEQNDANCGLSKWSYNQFPETICNMLSGYLYSCSQFFIHGEQDPVSACYGYHYFSSGEGTDFQRSTRAKTIDTVVNVSYRNASRIECDFYDDNIVSCTIYDDTSCASKYSDLLNKTFFTCAPKFHWIARA